MTSPLLARHVLWLVAGALALVVRGADPAAPPRATLIENPAERARIEQALPKRAPAAPRQPRRLLIFDLNVGYGGHRSIQYAEEAFTLMGERTGAFTAVISRDPAVFAPESLRQFDAVFLNNTVGNLFTDPALRRSLLDFVYGGGGLMGVHGTTVAFTQWPGAREDWPEFGVMLGARGANHRDSDERVILKLDDAAHPLNRPFGGSGFEFRDEFFRVHDPYSRQRVRVLLAIDNEKTGVPQGPPRGDCVRADNDYALAWVRNYGRGRVFYCTMAHNPYVFWDARMLEFYLGAVQFVLGDLAAPTIPSSRVTPAVRAQERLGWRVGLEPRRDGASTLAETAEAAARLGVAYVSASQLQKLAANSARTFDEQLTDDELSQVRLQLDAAGARLLAYHVTTFPADAAGCRKTFEFARKMGVETLVASPPPERLEALEKLCGEFGVNLALAPAAAPPGTRSPYDPEGVTRLCRGRSPRLGAWGDVGAWLRSGVEPLKALRLLKDRLLGVQLHDVNRLGAAGREVPCGAGAGQLGPFLRELHKLGMVPAIIGLEQGGDAATGTAAMAAESLAFLNDLSLKLGAPTTPGAAK